MSDQQLIQLIEAYLARVGYALDLFRRHLGIEDASQWRSQGLPRTGLIAADQEITYSFHGIGCCVETPEESIDWDFGLQGRTDGFDLWRLKNFADERPNQFGYVTRAKLEAAFSKASQSGLIGKAEADPVGHLFFLNHKKP